MTHTHDAVYLLSLTIENARCFGPKQTLDLSDGEGRPAAWTLVLGDNGIGKTTLLQAVAGLQPVRSGPGEGARYRPLLSARRDTVSLPMLRAPFDRPLRIGATFAIGHPLSARRVPDKRFETGVEIDPPGQVTTDTIRRGAAYGQVASLACYGYGATRRPGMDVSMTTDLTGSNSATLLSDHAELLNPEEWLLQADYAAAKAQAQGSGKAYRERLDLIKDTLIALLPDVRDIAIRGPRPCSPRPTARSDSTA